MDRLKEAETVLQRALMIHTQHYGNNSKEAKDAENCLSMVRMFQNKVPLNNMKGQRQVRMTKDQKNKNKNKNKKKKNNKKKK